MRASLLYFADEEGPATRLAQACGLPAACVGRHRFPDEELKLTLPVDGQGRLPAQLVVYRSLDRPHDKLIELLLSARQARELGCQHLILVAPYLAYMRQDMAFQPGEVVSQRVVGRFLAELFDALITVDPHLHRIKQLSDAIPLAQAISLSGAPLLGQLIAQHHDRPLLIGPDAESAQWVEAAAQAHHLDHGVCTKQRHGDKAVDISLPPIDVKQRAVVLLDDVASSGRTLATATRLLLEAGAASVDVAVTHALFAGDALAVIKAAGAGRIWSTDCVTHASNAIAMAPMLAQALHPLLKREAA